MMRACMLATAMFLAGCLHAQGPGRRTTESDRASLRTFEVLVNDAETIDDAQAFAKAKRLPRRAVGETAERAYWSFVRATIYPPAAEIAWRFKFGKRAIGRALEAQRKDADKALAAYQARKRTADGRKLLYAAIWELTLEMRISCRYGPEKADAEETVQRAIYLEIASGENDVLYPLLDEGCPVPEGIRSSIIESAAGDGRVDYAIRHAVAAGWDDVKVSQFLWQLFYYGDCTHGVIALRAFGLPVEHGARFIQNANCEERPVVTTGWDLPAKDADAYFFAAVRGRKWNLALTFLPLGTHGADGEAYLFQEAVRVSHEAKLVAALRARLGLHDAFMAYLWGRGRYRFIANYALTIDWQRKAFDKLLELKQYDFAAEAAHYGVSEALKTEGILIAFRAAMAAGDFKMGRYFLARYGPVKDKPGLVTKEMFEDEREKWYAARKLADPNAAEPSPQPKPKRKAKRKRRKPPCPDGDWCP